MDNINIKNNTPPQFIFTDRFNKNLMSLPEHEKEKTLQTLEKYIIEHRSFEKINTTPNLYQIRQGKYRIIMHKLSDTNTYLLSSIINR